MFPRVVTIMGIAALSASALLADFSYQEKSTITGGALASMMKVAAVFSKQAREPMVSTIAVKGDKMVHRGVYQASIIDLGSQTITTVDLHKKTYSVMTFEQMKQMLDNLRQSMQNNKNQSQGQDNVQMSFKVSANATGNSKQINGYDAKEMLIKMEMDATDQTKGQQGAMTITSDMWMAPAVSGYAEIRDFYRRMAEKIGWTPGSSMFMNQPQVVDGWNQVYKEMAKLDGMPVFQTVIMGSAGQPPANGSNGSAQQQQPQQQQQDSSQNSKPSVGGALGSALGGHFGLGRKKQQQQQQDSQPAQNSSQNSGTLLEMTTEMSAFSSSAVDDSQFAVPAGFKQVEAPEMRRAR